MRRARGMRETFPPTFEEVGPDDPEFGAAFQREGVKQVAVEKVDDDDAPRAVILVAVLDAPLVFSVDGDIADGIRAGFVNQGSTHVETKLMRLGGKTLVRASARIAIAGRPLHVESFTGLDTAGIVSLTLMSDPQRAAALSPVLQELVRGTRALPTDGFRFGYRMGSWGTVGFAIVVGAFFVLRALVRKRARRC